MKVLLESLFVSLKMVHNFLRSPNSDTFQFKWKFQFDMHSKVNVFKHNEGMNIMKHRATLWKVKFENKKDEDNKEKIENAKTFLLFLLFSLGSLQKIEIWFYFNLLP